MEYAVYKGLVLFQDRFGNETMYKCRWHKSMLFCNVFGCVWSNSCCKLLFWPTVLMSTRRHMCNLCRQGLLLVFNQCVFDAHILPGTTCTAKEHVSRSWIICHWVTMMYGVELACWRYWNC